MQLRRVDVGKLVQTQSGLVAEHPLDLLIPVPRPQRPQRQVGMFRLRKPGQPVDAAVLPDPVPHLHMVRVSVLREARALRLLGREKALLCLGDVVKTPGTPAGP